MELFLRKVSFGYETITKNTILGELLLFANHRNFGAAVLVLKVLEAALTKFRLDPDLLSNMPFFGAHGFSERAVGFVVCRIIDAVDHRLGIL